MSGEADLAFFGGGVHTVDAETPRAQAVAAFQVRDPALAAGPVAGEASLGAFRAGRGTAGDESPFRRERLLARLRLEAAIERELAR